jgi:hypothetical protein
METLMWGFNLLALLLLCRWALRQDRPAEKPAKRGRN